MQQSLDVRRSWLQSTECRLTSPRECEERSKAYSMYPSLTFANKSAAEAEPLTGIRTRSKGHQISTRGEVGVAGWRAQKMIRGGGNCLQAVTGVANNKLMKGKQCVRATQAHKVSRNKTVAQKPGRGGKGAASPQKDTRLMKSSLFLNLLQHLLVNVQFF